MGLRPEDKGLVETIEKWPPEVTSLLRTSELFSTCRSIPQVDCGPTYIIPTLYRLFSCLPLYLSKALKTKARHDGGMHLVTSVLGRWRRGSLELTLYPNQ